MRLPCLLQFRILKVALKSLFSRPFTDPFPAGDYQPIPQFRGRPRGELALLLLASSLVVLALGIAVTHGPTLAPPE